jgi:hypothetical protein
MSDDATYALNTIEARIQKIERFFADNTTLGSVSLKTFSPKQPPSFSGASTNDFSNWQKKLKTYFDVMEFSDTEALKTLPIFLDDKAYDSFDNFLPSQKTDLTTALDNLRQIYHPSASNAKQPEQKSHAPVDAVAIPELMSIMPNASYTSFPPQTHNSTNRQFQQPFGPRPRTQRFRDQTPFSQYGTSVQPQYIPQPIHDRGHRYIPKKRHQPRPRMQYHPFCTRCNCAHAYGHHHQSCASIFINHQTTQMLTVIDNSETPISNLPIKLMTQSSTTKIYTA